MADQLQYVLVWSIDAFGRCGERAAAGMRRILVTLYAACYFHDRIIDTDCIQRKKFAWPEAKVDHAVHIVGIGHDTDGLPEL